MQLQQVKICPKLFKFFLCTLCIFTLTSLSYIHLSRNIQTHRFTSHSFIHQVTKLNSSAIRYYTQFPTQSTFHPHHVHLNFWTDYLKWHSKHKHNKHTRKLVFQGYTSGLGDHFRALVNNYIMAVVTQRVMYLLWPSPTNLSDIFASEVVNRFEYTSKERNVTHNTNDSVNAIVYSDRRVTAPKILEWLISPMDNHIDGVRQPPQTSGDLEYITKRYYGYCHKMIQLDKFSKRYQDQCHDYRQHIKNVYNSPQLLYRAILRNIFPLSLDIHEKASTLLRQLRLCPWGTPCDKVFNSTAAHLTYDTSMSSNENSSINYDHPQARFYMGVHARVGVGLGEQKNYRFKKMANKLHHIAKCLAETALARAEYLGFKSEPVIFLATDTVEFRGLFEEQVLIRNPKASVVCMKDEPLHVSHIRRKTISYEEKREMMERTLAEVLVLGHGIDLLYYKSGFSRLAFWYGTTPNRKEIRHWETICPILREDNARQ